MACCSFTHRWTPPFIYFLQGLESLTNLKILDIADNRITSLVGIETLSGLTDLWANNNAIENLGSVEAQLKPAAATLETLYLAGNPCAGEPKYKLRMMHLLPKLGQLDDNVVERLMDE